jgi:hypothetical protein
MRSIAHTPFLLLIGLLVLASYARAEEPASEPAPYQEFKAYYDAKANGIGIGTVLISLQAEDAGRYRYQQESISSGIARLFGGGTSVESSLWRFDQGQIQSLEYRSEREDGDDDDNARLIFDWDQHRVSNIGAGEHWDIALPDGAIDRLTMQLAMLVDLRQGKTSFSYQVPRQGRIKDYSFTLLGQDEVELTSGIYNTLKVGRTNDDQDQSWIWCAPELDYFPVRFLKQKQSGIKLELILRKLDFAPFGDATSLEVVP